MATNVTRAMSNTRNMRSQVRSTRSTLFMITADVVGAIALAVCISRPCSAFQPCLAPLSHNGARSSHPSLRTLAPRCASFDHGRLRMQQQTMSSTNPIPVREFGQIPSVPKSQESLVSFIKVFKQRMWTKMDFLHLHAISGALLFATGIPFSLWRTFAVTQCPEDLLSTQASVFTPIFAGLVLANIGSGLKMNHSKKPGSGDGFNALSLNLVAYTWGTLFFSGNNPLSTLDPVCGVLASLAMLGVGFPSFRSAAKQLKSSKLFRDGKEFQDFEETNHIAMFQGFAMVPFFLAMGFGGSEGLARFAQDFPLQPALLYNLCLNVQLTLLGSAFSVSLLDRKLMSTQQLSVISRVLLYGWIPLYLWDVHFMGTQATLDLSAYASLLF